MKRIIIVWFSVLVSGCATIAINSDYDPDAVFGRLETYRWLERPERAIDDPRVNNTLLDKRVRAAVDRVLAAKGMRLERAGPVDFLVGYHATLDKRKTIHILNDYYRYAPGWGYRYHPRYSPLVGTSTRVYEYDEGTLILDIVTPDTRELIWRGSARDEVNFSATPEQRVAKINEAVDRVLELFPPSIR